MTDNLCQAAFPLRRTTLLILLAGVLLIGPPPALAQTTPADAAPAVDFDPREVADYLERTNLSEEQLRGWIDNAELITNKAKSQLTFSQRVERALLNPWVMFGLLAQGTFMMRFVIQLIASERKKKSYVPVAFWYLSLAGGVMLFAYALQLRDPVFVLGQGLGCFIYVRNLILIYRRHDALQDRLAERQNRTAARTVGDSPEPT